MILSAVAPLIPASLVPVQALPNQNSVVSIITLRNDNHRLYGITRSFESRRHAGAITLRRTSMSQWFILRLLKALGADIL